MSRPRRSRPALLHICRTALGHAATGLRGLAFWAAVWLPFVYVPLIASEAAPVSLTLALLIAHGCCLLLGHAHGVQQLRRSVGATTGQEGGV